MMNDPTNARWTRGPWLTELRGLIVQGDGPRYGNIIVMGRIDDGGQREVARTPLVTDLDEANARLIAVAPTLADLMLRVLPERQTAKWTETEVADWYEAARVALRKAGAL